MYVCFALRFVTLNICIMYHDMSCFICFSSYDAHSNNDSLFQTKKNINNIICSL
jgi:hypothetical protein